MIYYWPRAQDLSGQVMAWPQSQELSGQVMAWPRTQAFHSRFCLTATHKDPGYEARAATYSETLLQHDPKTIHL